MINLIEKTKDEIASVIKRGVEKAGAAFRAAGMQDVACKLYDGRHEILNEKNRQLVYDDVLAFYERHLD